MSIRKMLAIIIALVMCVSLCACTEAEPPQANIDTKPETFIAIIEGDAGLYADQTIMYDPDTLVMYTYLDGNYAGVISVLYNSDGTFKLYSPNTETE